jgi:hypothetical protein
MKKNILFIALLLGCLVFFTNCEKDNESVNLTELQKATKALSDGSPWTVSSIDSKPSGVSEQDAAALLFLKINFRLSGSGASIEPAGITASGAPDFLFTQSGATWNWVGGNTNAISLSNSSTGQFTNIQLLPSADNPTSIKLTFVVATTGGRIGSVVGTYTVTLTK